MQLYKPLITIFMSLHYFKTQKCMGHPFRNDETKNFHQIREKKPIDFFTQIFDPRKMLGIHFHIEK